LKKSEGHFFKEAQAAPLHERSPSGLSDKKKKKVKAYLKKDGTINEELLFDNLQTLMNSNGATRYSLINFKILRSPASSKTRSI
jgi:hypothetical protein